MAKRIAALSVEEKLVCYIIAGNNTLITPPLFLLPPPPSSKVTRIDTADKSMESDCFCVKDDKGNKVCEPDNCDVGKPSLS